MELTNHPDPLSLTIIIVQHESLWARAKEDVRLRKIISPEVRSDGQVVFRLLASRATSVELKGSFLLKGISSLIRDNRGVWTTTVGPITPGVYEYSFVIDGAIISDPSNIEIKPSHRPRASILTIPGKPPSVYDRSDVLHGTIHRHTYYSHQLHCDRSFQVYTPPAYEEDKHDLSLPVLALLPGSGDTEEAWIKLGRANLILDNLIASGSAESMILVMPDGEIENSPKGARGSHAEASRLDLIEGVLPLIHRFYRTEGGNGRQGILGVSRGGGEALLIGLLHQNVFAWVGGFSSIVFDRNNILSGILNKPHQLNSNLRALHIACGTDEFFLYDLNFRFHEALLAHGIRHEFLPVDGTHGWPLWRHLFADFVVRLFR